MAPRGSPRLFDATRSALPGNAFLVSTAISPTDQMVQEAREVSKRICAQFVPRGKQSVASMLDSHGATFGYMVTRRAGRTTVRHELCRREDNLRLAVNPRMWSRVASNQGGFRDAPLARALCPPGTDTPVRVVDATAGLGGTALRIAASFQCAVTALEASAPLASLLHYGMRTLGTDDAPWSAAARCVTAVHADAATFDYAVAGGGERPCCIYLNPCLPIRRAAREDLFLQQVASLQPISALCLHHALDTVSQRVVLRVPSDAEANVVHGLRPSLCVTGGQSNYLVFEK